MNTIDLVLIGIILLSIILSLFKGFIKEVLSLINWFAAFIIAKLFYVQLAGSGLLSSLPENVRIPVAIIIIFVASFFIGLIIMHYLANILRKTSGSVNFTDRVLGMLFGALRGVMIVCLLLAICKMAFSLGLFAFVQKMPLWAGSSLIPEFDKIVVWFFDKIDMQNIVNDMAAQLQSPFSADQAADGSAGGLAIDPSLLSSDQQEQMQSITDQHRELLQKNIDMIDQTVNDAK